MQKQKMKSNSTASKIKKLRKVIQSVYKQKLNVKYETIKKVIPALKDHQKNLFGKAIIREIISDNI